MHDIRIRTERLLLRPLTTADAEAVFAWASDERVSRYMVYATYTDLEQVRDWLALVEKDSGTYYFGFQRLSDGKLIGSGDIGLHGAEGESRKKEAWGFGYNLRYDCWGYGYATEAVKAMMEHARKNWGAVRFVSSHAEPNAASGHVMEKCGLRVACGINYTLRTETNNASVLTQSNEIKAALPVAAWPCSTPTGTLMNLPFP